MGKNIQSFEEHSKNEKLDLSGVSDMLKNYQGVIFVVYNKEGNDVIGVGSDYENASKIWKQKYPNDEFSLYRCVEIQMNKLKIH
jgi:ATP phosphoribosyltransferase regulatory subunit HisZ